MAQQMKHLKTSLETIDDGNEDNKQQSKIYAKDSMDRFGDDLCALIVSYLTFEDRFRYECVSKQFRRTVFGSVVDINLNVKPIKREDNSKTPLIDFRGVGDTDQYILELFPTIQHKFPKLREIYCNFTSNSDRWVQQLSPLVTRVGDISPAKKQSLTHCHRLSNLSVNSLSDVFDNTSGQLLAKNLHSFKIKRCDGSERLARFVAGNQSLKFVDILCENPNHLTEMCGHLSRLPHLRKLTLGSVLMTGQTPMFHHSLRTIGVNCKQLKRLSLALVSKTSHLKSMNELKHYRRLTRLMIALKPLDSTLLSNYGQHLPPLQWLTILTDTITRECLSHISRLPALQTLVIHCNQDIDLSDNDFNDVLSRSPKLKDIFISINNKNKLYSK
ncbi:unnamed protein product [Medioppia subpectinata]|uniref:F-box domain-containing protein n=1 Tax=Medioppia subpectinata TaxID=1979941 RepID=A0A7R9KTQ8_9ACAR|nr:unnamed protein product [Medioppia subpectinata]CAG2109646.1 unnamed protein product [Medioppia subpectinata]